MDLKCGDRALAIGSRTFVMGIVNATPDSFSDAHAHDAVAHALALLADGADVLDIGGESTRPNATPVSPADERARVVPVIEALVARGVRNLSVDTRNASTARAALAAGASWVNDVSALRHDADMIAACATADALVLMHARDPHGSAAGARAAGAPDDAVLADVHGVLAESVARARSAGFTGSVIVDPGIGFGKDVAENIALTRNLARFRMSGVDAVLYGPSRKRWLGTLANVERAEDRDAATHGAIAFADADIVRVHDVKGAVHALRVVDALRGDAR